MAWIGAETADQIKAGLAELADRLGLYRPEDSADVTAVRVRNHLQTRSGPALLVFDNVVSLDAVRPYLPSAGPAQVVITSTSRGSQVGSEVPVEVFSPETALEFLREATGRDDPLAAELAAEVGYLPLALAQAAARIKAARWDYAKYLENFRKFPAEKTLIRRDGDPYPLGAATAILMALEPFQGSELLEVLSVLSPEGVSRQVLGGNADDELVRLHEASLVELAGDSSVLMHRLVQRVIRDRAADQCALTGAALLLSQRAQIEGDPWTYRHFGQELVRQVEALATNITPTTRLPSVEVVLRLRLWASNFLMRTADLARADLIAKEIRAEAVTRLGEKHLFPVLARQIIAQVMLSTRTEDFTDLLEKDLARLREEFGVEHPNTLTAATLLSSNHRQLGRAEDAIAVLEPWREDSTLNVVRVLARAYLAAGQPEDAIAVLERGLRGKADVESGGTLELKVALADAYNAVGRSDEAQRFYEHVRDAYLRLVGPDHPLSIVSASRLGITLLTHGQYDRARQVLEETHAIATKVLGADHQTTVLTRTALEAIRQD
ncbi:tetratricopeptide repeat protein [Lentzea sp. NPDC051838]|uniref:tetratricopeptide repeat protein n=1 Tax=Lentzea sp. NPDC051838 TaxID=3154849 RepID=UPI00342D82FE